ncbi:uncharacterized protein LOC132058048 [Lycium ferocissimum]|uniref:uncharacterized protein LOC132058048 n=1 Tax=Lycium ferocissimum TaxID=112874 RepID=UPI00281628E7|nr:uncharacterized protein LOC132058048 [Lycium ferocissimum]
MLKRYHGDGSYIIRWDSILLYENLSYEKKPAAILDRDVRKLRPKEIAFVKVQWKKLLRRQSSICVANTLGFSPSQPQTVGQFKRTIQVLEDMLQACVIDFSGHWYQFLLLAEFAYNNSYHSSFDMAPFEALHGRRCRSPIGWFDVFEIVCRRHLPDLISSLRPVPDQIRGYHVSIKMALSEALYRRMCRSPIGWFEVGEAGLLGVYQAMEKVKLIQEHLKTAQSRQKSYFDVRRRDLEF